MNITLHSLIERDPSHVSAMTAERETAVMSVAQGAYYGLNEVATRMWQLAECAITVGSICAALQMEYDIDQASCEREVIACLEQMISEGLMRVIDV
jgi:hypothetical protein